MYTLRLSTAADYIKCSTLPEKEKATFFSSEFLVCRCSKHEDGKMMLSGRGKSLDIMPVTRLPKRSVVTGGFSTEEHLKAD